MSAPVNVTALAAARAKMTSGAYALAEHAPDSDEGALLIVACDRPALIIATMTDDYEQEDDGAGLVATHNAADVLIEVARTLLIYNAAKREAARLRELWSKDWNNHALQSIHQVADRALLLSKAEHAAALAKVSL